MRFSARVWSWFSNPEEKWNMEVELPLVFLVVTLMSFSLCWEPPAWSVSEWGSLWVRGVGSRAHSDSYCSCSWLSAAAGVSGSPSLDPGYDPGGQISVYVVPLGHSSIPREETRWMLISSVSESGGPLSVYVVLLGHSSIPSKQTRWMLIYSGSDPGSPISVNRE